MKAIHGRCHTKEYEAWKSMKYRCYRKTHHAYYNYGARGITVCDEWKNNFQQFFDDMGFAKEGECLDRINNEQGYSKENCQWTTPKENNRNKRSCKYYEHKGKMLILREICEDLNLNYVAIDKRVTSYKWSLEEAISRPVRKMKSRNEWNQRSNRDQPQQRYT